MNVILLEENQKKTANCYVLSKRQQEHMSQIIKIKKNDKIKVGLLNGLMGEAVYQGEDESGLALIDILYLDKKPPLPLPITLILALPRPNMLKRTLLNISAMGVKKIILLNSAKVEKSYWQSPVLAPENIYRILIEGLEQARDTIVPTYEMMTRFRPYVEDILPSLTVGKQCLLAHPYQAQACPIDVQQESILAVGPEGGWNEFEVSKWQEAGFHAVHLGERILKVETAVPVLLSRLFPL